NRRTHEARDIQPKAGYGEKLRFNWNTPLHLTRKGTLYIGAQFLFRSRDRGRTWERISPDLTTNDPDKQKQEQSGGITVDNSSAEMHTTIYTICESPRNEQVIWAGTDDGNLQVTRDGGKSWTNVPPMLGSWVSWVEASPHDEATAYAAVDRHTFGDMQPHVFRTADYGRTWQRIAGPPVRGFAHVVREDPERRGLLYVGTEFGLWISPDAGHTWAEFKGGNFPAVPVRDLAFQPRDGDLVIGTHGRGIWIIDDLTPLRGLRLDREVAFLPSRPAQQRIPGIGGGVEGDAKFTGENPPSGALISYYQSKRHLFGPLRLEIVGPDGKVVDTLPAEKRRGINRVTWPMRVKPPRVPRGASATYSGSVGPRVLPGTYTVRLVKGDQTCESTLQVGLDRRAEFSLEERQQQYTAAMRVHALFGEMTALSETLQATRQAALERGDPELTGFADRCEELRKKIVATKEGGAITGEERLREHADNLYGALLSYEGKPPAYLLERIEVLQRELGDVSREYETLSSEINRKLEERGLPPLRPQVSVEEETTLSSGDLQKAFARFLGFPAGQETPRKGARRRFWRTTH
ncbi:MAG: sialidase, partial [Candidatus Eremiobacterota bacterium]